MAAEDFVDEEFWWMPLLGLPTQGRVGVAVSRWTPPDEDSLFEPIHGHSTIENLGIWAGEQRWENVHRTLEVVVRITLFRLSEPDGPHRLTDVLRRT